LELKEKIVKKRLENREKRAKALIKLGKFDQTADRENENLEFPLKSPEQEDFELKHIKERTAKNNKGRENLIEEITQEYNEEKNPETNPE
jgi:hypothetical protein